MLKKIIILLMLINISTISTIYGYNTRADINQDGVVDGLDLQIFAEEFGNVYNFSATFSWTVNTEPTLEGYRIYYGTESGKYTEVLEIPDSSVSTATVEDLVPGEKYYFVAVAYDHEGYESDYTDEIVWTAN